MSTEQQSRKSRKYLLAGMMVVLAFFAEGVLSVGNASTKHATALAAPSSLAAAGPASASPDVVSPREANADGDTLDLQLD